MSRTRKPKVVTPVTVGTVPDRIDRVLAEAVRGALYKDEWWLQQKRRDTLDELFAKVSPEQRRALKTQARAVVYTQFSSDQAHPEHDARVRQSLRHFLRDE